MKKIGAQVMGLKRVFYYLTDKDYKVGDCVVLKRKDGLFLTEIATEMDVLDKNHEIKNSYVVRKANAEDFKLQKKLMERQDYIMNIFVEAVDELDLKMTPLTVWQSLDNVHVNFFYYSPARVEFNLLIKMLIKKINFKIKIEMIHLDVREVYAQKEYLGICSYQCCCSVYNYSVASNKDYRGEHQDGLCGKTKCCLIINEKEQLNDCQA